MSSNQAAVVNPDVPGRLELQSVEMPNPAANEALIKVAAISLNRGEVRMAQSAEAGRRYGWDFAGTVERAAADGTGPKAGERVVGMLRSGAWAQWVAAPTNQVGVLPDGVSFAQAATLPVAGLTAYHALWKGGFLLGRGVLVTGATGGVGDYAIQLAKLSGAIVTAHIRKPEQETFVRTAGADNVAIGEDLTDAQRFAPYALVVESVGGKVLGDALALLDENSLVVSFGTSAGNQVTFDAQKFYNTGMVSLYGLILFDELRTVESADKGLTKLARLVGQGKLKPQISIEESWTKIAEISQLLLNRSYPGKAVLHLE